MIQHTLTSQIPHPLTYPSKSHHTRQSPRHLQSCLNMLKQAYDGAWAWINIGANGILPASAITRFIQTSYEIFQKPHFHDFTQSNHSMIQNGTCLSNVYLSMSQEPTVAT